MRFLDGETKIFCLREAQEEVTPSRTTCLFFFGPSSKMYPAGGPSVDLAVHKSQPVPAKLLSPPPPRPRPPSCALFPSRPLCCRAAVGPRQVGASSWSWWHLLQVPKTKKTCCRFQYTLNHLCAWHEAHTDNNRCSVAVARRLAFTVLNLVRISFPFPIFLFFLSFFLQACPENGVDLVPGLHIPEDSVSNANPADFDWGASEFVERRRPPRKTPGARRLQPTTDFFASGVLESWGSQDQAGFGATDVRFRPRHCFHPQVFSRIYLGLQICYRGKCNSNLVMSQDTGGSTAGTISAYLGDPTNRFENRFNPTLNPVILLRSEVLEEDCKSDITTNLSAIVITTDN